MKIDYAAYTDCGGRKNNEDYYCVEFTENGALFVLADGLGGHAGGERAAMIAVESVRSYVLTPSEDGITDIDDAIINANAEIVRQQKDKYSGMKTTICVVWITEEKTVFANVGDSRIYAFKGKNIVYMSKDHSVSRVAVDLGRIPLSEIRNHPGRNKLTRALGNEPTVSIDSFEMKNSAYDSLLICSDGLWEYVTEEEMEEIGRGSAKKKLKKYRAIHDLTAPENCDNNTAIVVNTR